MGILDAFDNPAFLQSLLGQPGDNGAEPPPKPPTPPPQVMANAGPSFGPGSSAGVDPFAPDYPGKNNGPGAAPPIPLGPDAPQTVNAATQTDREAMPAPPAPYPGVTGPRNTFAERFVGEPTTSATPATDDPTAPRIMRTALPGPQAPMPPPSSGGGPPVASNGGGLMGALGLDTRAGQRSAIAGLGKGLSAVGAQTPGTPKGYAFAAGAGGGITGNIHDQDEQRNMARQDKNDQFAQSSTAFKDMLAAKASRDNEGLTAARAKYLAARAQALMTGGVGANGSRSMLNTPDGKVAYVESQVLKYRDQIRKSAEAKAKAKGEEVDEDAIEKVTEAYRARLYKGFKMDPKEAEKIMNRGMDKDNPFDTKGMSLDQFNETVPMGAWFKDQNGVLRQRVKPPASMQQQPRQPQQADAQQTANDDQEAMAG